MPAPFPRATLTILGVGAFATGTDAFVIAGLLPSVAGELQTSAGAVGVTVTLFAVAYAVGGPVLVAACARIAPKRTMLAALAVFVVANVLAALAPTLAVLALARVLAALGAGVYVPGAIAAAAALGGQARRGRATAAVVGGASLALVLGVPLGTLAGEIATWRGSFALVALLGAVALAGVAVLVAEQPPAPAPAPAPELCERLALLRRPAVVAVLGVTLLANTAAFSVYTYLGLLFPTGVALVVLGFGVGALVGTWLGGRAADAFGPTRVVVVVVAVFALDHLALGLVAGSVALGVVYAVVWGLSGWATVPAQQARLIERCEPAHQTLALSLNSSATHLGTGVGALAGAAVIAGPGPGWLFAFAGVVSLVALALVPLRSRSPEVVA